MNFQFPISNFQSKYRISKFGILKFLILLGIGYWVLGIFSAAAQAQPELMLTWKANSYVPANYQGRVLPTDGTRVDMAVELIENGRLADLSNVEIRWLVNDEPGASGRGMKTFSFNANRLRGNQAVDVVLVKYRGADLEKRINIPTVAPQAVIEVNPDFFKALLYFFNIQNLSQAKFTWSASGTQTAGAVENPNLLSLDLSNVPKGSEITLQVEVQNLLKPLEIATKSLQVTKE